ncbi:FHA domain-containing protein [Zavarzinia sp. CC-PAN008]|uniref:FHA domain-containing protein n=1 Tax=Zavarzinia sp. CC-PAN008 TaxID=3243332 RepID=UPI003F744CD8
MSRTKLRALLSLGFWQPPGDPAGISREELERIIAVHGGTLRFDLGMLPLVELQSVEDGALCALAIVDRIPPQNAGHGGMGIHLGDTLDPEGGPSTEVRAAAMMAQRTPPGRIGISRLASMQIAGKMQVVLADAGEVAVPGMNRPLRMVTMALPAVETPAVEAPVAEPPPVDAPPPVEAPPVEVPLVEAPSVEVSPVEASTVNTPPPLEVPAPIGTPPGPEAPPPMEVPPPVEAPPAEVPPPLEIPPMEVPPPAEVPPPLEPPPPGPAEVPPPIPQPPSAPPPVEAPPVEPPPVEAPPAGSPAVEPPAVQAVLEPAADATAPVMPPPLPPEVQAEASPGPAVIVETLPTQPPPVPEPPPLPPVEAAPASLPDAVIVESVPVVTSAEAPIAPAPPIEEPPPATPQEAPPPAEEPPATPVPAEEPPPPPEAPPPAPVEEPPAAEMQAPEPEPPPEAMREPVHAPRPDDEDRTTMALAPPPPPAPPPVADDEDGTLIGVRTSLGVRGVTAGEADAAQLDRTLAAADAAMAAGKPYAALYELDGALADGRARGVLDGSLARLAAKREAITATLGFPGDARMVEEAGSNPRAIHLLVGGTKRIGRAGTSIQADISVGFRLVSRADRQTRITAMRDGYVIEDLGGTNAACLAGRVLDAGRKVVVDDGGPGPNLLSLGGVREPLEEGDCRFELLRRRGHLILTLTFAHLDDAGLVRLAEHWENWRSDAGATWIMVGGPIVLGTGEEADLRLDEGEGRIARIDHLGGSYSLTPLDGDVLVDDVPVLATVRLRDGCRIALGGEVFSFRSTGA